MVSSAGNRFFGFWHNGLSGLVANCVFVLLVHEIGGVLKEGIDFVTSGICSGKKMYCYHAVVSLSLLLNFRHRY
jgi:hypothetical protein